MPLDMFFNLYSHFKRNPVNVWTYSYSKPKNIFLKICHGKQTCTIFYHYRMRPTEKTEFSIIKHISPKSVCLYVLTVSALSFIVRTEGKTEIFRQLS